MHMVIQIGYSKRLLLPVADGAKVIDALANARVLVEEYSKPKVLKPLEADDLGFSLISDEAVEAIQIQRLLGNAPDE